MAAAVLAGVMAGRAEAACSLKQIGEMKIEMLAEASADARTKSFSDDLAYTSPFAWTNVVCSY